MENGPKMIEWLMLFATFSGPLVGIWVTRLVDRANDKTRRREAVFETLVRTRGLELSPEHVSALNMVPLLFKEAVIRSAYGRVMEVLNDSALGSNDREQREAPMRKLVAARQDLIREIGRAVGTPLPDNEHERHGYAPQGWADAQNEAGAIRQGLLEVLEGRRAVNMIAGIWQVGEAPRVPPEPQIDQLPQEPS